MVGARYHRDSYRVEAGAADDGVTATVGAGVARRRVLADATTGALHIGASVRNLEPGAAVDPHLHSVEESIYVLEGRLRLGAGSSTLELGHGEAAFIPLGVAHELHAGGQGASWVEVQTPGPRPAEAEPPDTFAVTNGDRPGVRGNGRASSCAGRAASVGGFAGVAITMLVDGAQGAALHRLFTVACAPGAVVPTHDHPFEECFYVLDGEVEVSAEGERFTLTAGDFLWAGVGCMHDFANRSEAPVHWLEVQSPQPPERHAFRFARDWVMASPHAA